MNSSLIRKTEAGQAIAAINDSEKQEIIASILESEIDLYRAEPSQLVGLYDLLFLVHVVTEEIDDVIRALGASEFVEDVGSVPVKVENDSGPTGLRQRQALTMRPNSATL